MKLAAALPEGLDAFLPPGLLGAAEEGGTLLTQAVEALQADLAAALQDAIEGSLRSALCLVLVALLCGLARCTDEGGAMQRCVRTVGVLCITSIAAGDLRALIGLGTDTVASLHTLTRLLLPTMAAAMAGGGYAGTASAWQIGTLFASERLTALLDGVLLPLTFGVIALAAVGTILPESGLTALSKALRDAAEWLLRASMVLFTAYLMLSNVLSGAVDRSAVKTAKFALSSALPVVGSIVSDAAETVLAGASALRGTVGVLGVLAVLFVCAAPFVRLGLQYLVYKAASVACAMTGPEPLSRYIDTLGGIFGLVLGMTGSCALILLTALFVSMTMVVM